MERYIEELIEIYRKNTLKSDEESLKSLLRNVHRDGFIAGAIINVVDKLTKRN